MTATMQNEIQIGNISQELRNLWNKEQGEKKIRASLFTLIVYLQKGELASFYQNIIKSVVAKFPCRVMMIVNDKDHTEEYLRTTVSAETIGEGELKVYCELIQIEVAGSLIERVPYMVLPHLLPDLPIYLLWTEDPARENAVLPHLEPLADRTIFDSRSTSDLQNYACAVLSLMKQFHCNVGDLNWSAISGWRHIFSQTFNDLEAFSSLEQSRQITIHYQAGVSEKLALRKNNGSEGERDESRSKRSAPNEEGIALCYGRRERIDMEKSQPPYDPLFLRKASEFTEFEAAYFQAWLASRLNWKFQALEYSGGQRRLTYRRKKDEVVVVLNPQENGGPAAGTILGLEVESGKNEGHYAFKRHAQSRQVFIQYSEKDFCELPVSSYLAGSEEGQEILEEIFYPSSGKHYHDMLEILSLIPWRA